MSRNGKPSALASTGSTSSQNGDRRPLLAFPFHDWHKGIAEGFRTRDGHLMKEFARREGIGPVVVIDRPTSRAEHLLRRKPYRVPGDVVWEERLGAYRCWVTAAVSNVLVIDVQTPDVASPVISGRAWWFDVFARDSVLRLLASAIRAVGATGSPGIAWSPTVSPAIGALQPSPFVFDSLDNWLIHPTLRRHRDRASECYADLLPRAEAVFVSAPRSAAVLAEWRRDISILPNGVDVDHVRISRPRPQDLPSGPIVGYAGKLAERIDTELVDAVARRMPNASFVFVGPILSRRAISPLRSRPNVVFLGDRHYDVLPAYLQHFDVAWIPHRVGEGESGGDPIKLYEYWAAGKPVVSTAIDGLERHTASLAIVRTPDQAVEAITEALLRPRRQVVPPARTWPAIASVLLDVLFPDLAVRAPGSLGSGASPTS